MSGRTSAQIEARVAVLVDCDNTSPEVLEYRPRTDAEVDGLFLTYYIRSSEGREIMKSLAQGSTRYNLSKKALLAAEVRVPRLPEQVAIAETLSDMDAELTALEAHRDKTRALKKGIMQELLTGRTRLV